MDHPSEPNPGYDVLALPLLLAASNGFACDVAPAAAACRASWWDRDLWVPLGRASMPPWSAHAPPGETPLHAAAAVGDSARVQWLLTRCSAPPDPVSDLGWTPLLRAAAATVGDAVATATALLDTGADLDLDAVARGLAPHNSAYVTPLSAAALRGDAALVALLLARGADPAPPSWQGSLSPLQAAARGGSTQVIRALLAASKPVSDEESEGSEEGEEGVGEGDDVVLALLEAIKTKNRDATLALLDVVTDVNHVFFSDDDNDAPTTALIEAAKWGDTAVVASLLTRGADARLAAPVRGLTPLHAAASKGNATTIRSLIAAGAVVDARDRTSDEEDETALVVAVTYGHVDAAAALLDAGANVNAWCETTEGAFTPLMASTRHGMGDVLGMVKLLVARGSDPRQLGDALLLTALCGDADVAHVLLDAGADVNYRTEWVGSELSTPLLCACSHYALCNKGEGHRGPAIASLLLQRGADPTLGGAARALHAAAQSGFLDVVEAVLRSGARLGEGVLDGAFIRAAARGHAAVARVLLDAGADIRAVTRYESTDMTPLHAACQGGLAALVSLLCSRDAGIARAAFPDGRTPLHVADSADVIEALVAAGADVDALKTSGTDRCTPLLEAASLRYGSDAAAAALLQAGADPNVEGVLRGRRLTPLIAACEAGRVALVSLLLERGADAGRAAAGGRTPLHAAAAEANAALVDALLAAGAPPDSWQRDDTGAATPLLLAAASFPKLEGYGGWVSPLATASGVVRSLLRAGADPNAEGQVDGAAATPLLLASRAGAGPVVTQLLVRGAAPGRAVGGGETPLRAAAAAWREDLVAVLRHWGAAQ